MLDYNAWLLRSYIVEHWLSENDLKQLQKIQLTEKLASDFREALNKQICGLRNDYQDPNNQLKNKINALPLSDDAKKLIFKDYIEDNDFISIPIIKIDADGKKCFQELSKFLSEVLENKITTEHVMNDESWNVIQSKLKEEKYANNLIPGSFMVFTYQEENKFLKLCKSCAKNVSHEVDEALIAHTENRYRSLLKT